MNARLAPGWLVLTVWVLLPSSGFAQVDAQALTGCFRFEAGPYADDSTWVVPTRNVLRDVQFLQPSGDGRLRVLRESSYYYRAQWIPLSAATLYASLSVASAGVVMRLDLVDDTLFGVGHYWSVRQRFDRIGFDPTLRRVAITGKPIPCPTGKRPNKR